MKSPFPLLFLFLLLFSIVLSAQDEKKYEIREKIKLSKIKTRTDYTYFVDKPGNEYYKTQTRYYDKEGRDTLIEIFSLSNNNVFSKIVKNFNNSGLLIEKTEYRLVPSAKENDPTLNNTTDKEVNVKAGSDNFIVDVVTKYLYDKFGNEINQTDFDNTGKFLKSSSAEYTYDNKGNILVIIKKGTLKNENLIEKYSYNSSGCMIGRSIFDVNGVFKGSASYLYDSSGIMQQMISFKPDSTIKERSISKYDEKKRLIEKIQYTSDSTITFKTTFCYNKNNYLIESVKEQYGKPVDFKKMVTTYDDFGNILTITKYDEVGKPFRLQKYVYTFY